MQQLIQIQVRDALAKLGVTSADIAASLANKGITGYRYATKQCPLARYLAEQFPEYTIGVGNTTVTIWQPGWSQDLLDLTMPQAEFVNDFDHGRYPELDQR